MPRVDWTTVVTSIATSTIIVTILAFVAKRFVDRTIQHHFVKREKNFEASLLLRSKKLERLLIAQTDLYGKALSQVWHVRDAYRDVLHDLRDERKADFKNLNKRVHDLVTTMQENRILFQAGFWDLIYGVKDYALQLAHAYDDLERVSDQAKKSQARSALVATAEEQYKSIESLGKRITETAQRKIGLDDNLLDPQGSAGVD